jgi:uncharacterized protein YjbJ (UPF0337 family)
VADARLAEAARQGLGTQAYRSDRAQRLCCFSLTSHSGWHAFRRTTMNKDQIEGKLKNIGGKIQEEVGDLIDSPEQEAKGFQKQTEGKVQEKVGDLKEAVRIATK